MIYSSTAVVVISDLAPCLIAFSYADLWQNFGEILVVFWRVEVSVGVGKSVKNVWKKHRKGDFLGVFSPQNIRFNPK